ncbi:hypothetical protein DFP73DRAFT_616800 [Morchella snyderi]|nr:hypothetical protein DFP73DRAFT_616800 [Morchella snyderi]
MSTPTPIFRNFLLLSLLLFIVTPASTNPAHPRHTRKKWCKIPEEFCTTHDNGGERACYMPLGMRCEKSGEIVDVTETIIETGMLLFYFGSYSWRDWVSDVCGVGTVTVTMPYDGAEETQEGYLGNDIDMDGQEAPMKATEDASRNKSKRTLYTEAPKPHLTVDERLLPRAAETVFSRFDFTAKAPAAVFREYMGNIAAQASATAKPTVRFERLPELMIENINGVDMVSEFHGGFKRYIVGEEEPYGDDEFEHDEGYHSDDGDDGDGGDGGEYSLETADEMPTPLLPKTIWADKPILEVSCVVRARLLWDDFKITWGPAWKDDAGCRRLFTAMNKRGLVTGYKCGQFADPATNSFHMEARGHRPRFPKSLVADAIREGFGNRVADEWLVVGKYALLSRLKLYEEARFSGVVVSRALAIISDDLRPTRVRFPADSSFIFLFGV